METAARYAAGLPEGPERRQALMLLCNKEERNERVISRMISAREYALKWIDEDKIRASHTAVELLRTLENANPAKAASVRLDVLQGKISRPQLDLMLKNIKYEAEAKLIVKISISIEDIVRQCRKDVPFVNEFEWREPPTDEMGTMLGADMEFTFDHAVEDENGIIKRTYERRWALIISPYISCSRIFGEGLKGFVLSTMALSCFYPKVSAFCAAGSEERYLKKMMEISGNPSLIEKVITHLPNRR